MFFQDGNIYQKLLSHHRKELNPLSSAYNIKTIPSYFINHVRKHSGRISLLIWKKASLTVETALVLPLLLYSILIMLSFGETLRYSSYLMSGVSETAKEMAVNQFGLEALGITAEKDGLISGGVSVAYARIQLNQHMAGFQASPILKNTYFTILESDFLKNQVLDLKVTAFFDNPFQAIPIPQLRITNRGRVRAWTGRSFQIEEETEGENNQETIVYITETGKVYHRNRDCTYLRLSIRSINRTDIDAARNKSGGKYYPCERCGYGQSLIVYVTDYGDRYHSSLDCSGLKRTIREVKLSEAEASMPACSKCGGGS